MNDNLIDGRDRFEYWLMDMDDALAAFVARLPADAAARLDYSPDSLVALEAWLLSRYAGPEQATAPAEARLLDGAARYVGEVFRKNIGGKWAIELADTKNAFHGLPQIAGLPGQRVQLCPLTLVTATTDRRTGRLLHTIFLNNRKIV